jgi:hypothetical protein
MTGKELWEQYQRYTRDITEHCRVLGFAGAGICWMFKGDDFAFPHMIALALLLVVAYFVADLMQFLAGAVTLKAFVEREEAKMWREKGTIDGEIKKPRWVDRPAFAFFAAKIALLLAGFAAIGAHLARLLCA